MIDDYLMFILGEQLLSPPVLLWHFNNGMDLEETW
jgi:hypothetical protein